MTAQPNETIAHRICPVCEATCGLEIRLSEGKVIGIRGHDADVFSAGFICPKGAAIKDLHEDPDRLRKPLVKRDGKFVETSWEEAFAEIERRLPPIITAYGRDAVAVVIGNPVVHNVGLLTYFPRLGKALGTRNLFSASTLDQMPKQLSAGLMFGNWLSIPVPDIDRSDFLLILGANPAASNGSLWTVPDFRGRTKAMQARGGRLVVVDPRRNETAAMADRHHFIRPGADVFFLLGLVHTLFEESLVRLGSVEQHVAGLDDLRRAVQPFAAERVATRCGIPASDIRGLARELAVAKSAAVYGRMGTCTQIYGTLANWLMDVLNIITGNLDVPGGAMFPKAPALQPNTMGEPGRGRGIVTGRRKSRVSQAPEVFGEFPITCLAEEIETAGEGQVRAAIIVAGNPVLSAPDSARLSAALEQLDFVVSLDIYLNETSRHADVILPGASPLEDVHYDVAFHQLGYRNAARYSPAVLTRAEGEPAEWETILHLVAIIEGKGVDIDIGAFDDELIAEDVRRMAAPQEETVLKALSHRRGPERLVDLGLRTGPYGDMFGLKPDGLNLDKLIAKPEGIDLGPLQPRIPEALRTPSGKVELAPPMLIEDLERVAADIDQPTPDLVIVGRRQVRSNNSWLHNLPILAKGPFRCTAQVHPVDAARLKLTHGAKARITRANRAIEVQVEVSEEMMPGVVSLPHGWGHDLPGTKLSLAAQRPGANLNAIFDNDARDPLSGNAVLSGVPIQMSPAA